MTTKGGKPGQADRARDVQDLKKTAVQFLQMIIAGRIDEAYQSFASPKGKHHNPHFAAGFPALREAMKADHHMHPDKVFEVQHVIGDGDVVAVHSRLVPSAGESGMAVVHIFRFQNGKIVELWDCGQQAPADSPNHDGMF